MRKNKSLYFITLVVLVVLILLVTGANIMVSMGKHPPLGDEEVSMAPSTDEEDVDERVDYSVFDPVDNPYVPHPVRDVEVPMGDCRAGSYYTKGAVQYMHYHNMKDGFKVNNQDDHFAYQDFKAPGNHSFSIVSESIKGFPTSNATGYTPVVIKLTDKPDAAIDNITFSFSALTFSPEGFLNYNNVVRGRLPTVADMGPDCDSVVFSDESGVYVAPRGLLSVSVKITFIDGEGFTSPIR